MISYKSNLPYSWMFIIKKLLYLTKIKGLSLLGRLFLIRDMGTVGFVVSTVKFLYILIAVSFVNYFPILAVNFALQFTFLGKS